MKDIRKKLSGLKFIIAIPPVVLLMSLFFFVNVRNEIIRLSEDRLTLLAASYTYSISEWAGRVLNELRIYKELVEAEGEINEHVLDMLSASFEENPAYPFGVYWGDENGNFFDSSGWEPDDGFAVTERNWYIEGLRYKDFIFGKPYADERTGKTCVSPVCKLDTGGVESVMGADVYLDYISDKLKNVGDQGINNMLLVSKVARTVIAATDDSHVGRSLGRIRSSEVYRRIDSLIAEDFSGLTLIQAEKGYYVSINRVENTDWLLVLCVDSDNVLDRLHAAESAMNALSFVTCVVIVLIAFGTSKRMSETFRKAKADPLTKLYNRSSFKTIASRFIDDDPNRGVMLIFDMDNFKTINDTYGHPVGDEVLKGFAGLLSEFFNRADDVVARLGGDEFAVFMGRKVSRGAAAVTLEKFIQKFHEMFDEKYSAQKLSVSIGVSYAEDNDGGFSELYSEADTALYKAKENGKDGFYIQKGR